MATPALTPAAVDHVATLTAWLDTANPPGEHEVAMRIMKIGEEAGEVVASYIGMTGQNPRKGITHTREDLCRELCDVIVAAMVALATVTSAGEVEAHLSARFSHLAARLHAASVRRGAA